MFFSVERTWHGHSDTNQLTRTRPTVRETKISKATAATEFLISNKRYNILHKTSILWIYN